MDFLKKLGIYKIVLFSLSTLAVLVALVYFVVSLSKPIYGPLYNDLTQQDQNIVTLKLQSMGINYQVGAKNSQILVPADKVLSLRMYFAQKGLITSGNLVGYEIFDKENGLSSSQFLNNVNALRALEGELSRTINSLSQVENSRVHLVLPKKELFSKSSVTPSASIMLKLKVGESISKNEIKAITNLVEKAVPDLSSDNISIIDSIGSSLKAPGSEDNGLFNDNNSEFKSFEYQNLVEKKLKSKIENLLESRVGIGKVKVNVAAKINTNRQVMVSEVFDPDGQVIRSKKVSEEKEDDENDGDGISVANNIPNSNQQLNNSNSILKKKSKLDDITNYEISKTVTNKIIDEGRVEKLSVGILIDGYYVYDEKSKSNVYEKRSDEELEQLGALVKSAIGYDQNRGDTIEIVNLKFIDNNFEKDIQKANWLDDNLKNLIQMGMIGVIVILVILLIFRPILAKILEANKSGFGEINKFFDFKKFGTNNKYSGEDNMDNKDFSSSALNDYSESGGKKIPVGMKHKQILDKINELVENYPEEATEILKKWINNDQKIL
ncbi:flagellar basal-body MS-ring/collar protein FliF [Rickettsiales endosymbiont of Trichoplax sp. H2]|uniref:flagellar basal-body MS-ring/collar protein FliF n=1 Tax=Rickettsiales endosymbiont of Trichoplax sp. H2 TaxID=2021221 RepID=UPI0012B33236|nr:flagellar basal-body MS-ring/collar protein FliF [Rickettsiales endosymbiont of Trichoplax sp. H2]MSO13406.1 Flagellar M-ring protein [Rickettsiales endosymbiont of Trichoplax sp. H2]